MKRIWLAVVAGGLLMSGVGAGQAADKKAGNDTTATLVSLHYKDAAAGEVLKDFFGQVGMAYETPLVNAGGEASENVDGWPRVSIDLEKRPYWEAVAAIDDALRVTMHIEQNGNMLVHRREENEYDPEAGERCISGPCMMLALEARHSMELRQREHRQVCVVRVTLLVEPHVKVAMYSRRVEPDVAVDELGNSLLAEKVDGEKIPTVARDDTYSLFEVPLSPGDKAGYKIAELKGTAHLWVVDTEKKIEVPAENFAKGKSVDFKGATLTVAPVRKQPLEGEERTEYLVTVKVVQNGVSDADWGAINELLDGAVISIVDEKGKPYYQRGSGGGKGKGQRSFDATLRSADGFGDSKRDAGAAAKCVITLPEKMRDVAVPFEFKNLPLP